MKAFIAGASGYTGQALVHVLRARGIETVAHLRPDSSQRATLQPMFEGLGAKVDASPWEPTAIAATLAQHKPDIVFALLGTTQARIKKGVAQGETKEANSYEHVDYGLTHMLLEATKQSRPKARFVYLSSLGASESTGNAYLLVRGRVERELRESGLSWIIARPSFITGQDRQESRPLERVGAVVVDGALAALACVGLSKPRNLYGSMTGTQLARGLASVALDPGCANKVFETDALRARAT